MMLVPFAIKYQDSSSIVVLMPDDWRGASLKVFTERLGAIPYPMNLYGDSTLGTGRRLVKLVREVVAGKHIYLTPDGPDGTSFVIKPGLTYIAKKANAVILGPLRSALPFQPGVVVLWQTNDHPQRCRRPG